MSIVVHAISIGPRVITAATSVNVDRGPSLYSPSPRFQSLLHMAVPRTNQIKINEAETHLITLFGETSPFIHKTVEREREWRERQKETGEKREREVSMFPPYISDQCDQRLSSCSGKCWQIRPQLKMSTHPQNYSSISYYISLVKATQLLLSGLCFPRSTIPSALSICLN